MRELGEMASRRRTYVWRTVFAAVLLSLGYWHQHEQQQSYASALQVLGSGRWLFQIIIGWLGVTAFFGMPLLTCACIVSERERNTLSLLLTTQISPASLIMEKLAARLFVMLTLVMVSLPLMALAYSMGGVTGRQIISGVVGIVSLSVLSGSFGMLQSVRSGSAVGALVSTLLGMSLVSVFCGGGMAIAVVGNSPAGVFLGAVITLAVSSGLIMAAVRRVPQIAVEPPRSRLLAGFRKADRFFSRVNKGVGGIEFLRDRHVLPGDEPIFWRERYKRILGQTHHLIRVIALLEAPTVLIVSLVMTAGYNYRNPNPLGWLHAFLWFVAVVIVAIRAVGIWPQERSRETLAVLLTTPLSGRDLIDQTMRGVRRTIIVASVPIATVQLATFLIQPAGAGRWYYLTGSTLSLVTILPLTAWAAMLIGLRIKSQLRATMAVAAMFVAVVAMPRVLLSHTSIESSLQYSLQLYLLRAGFDPGVFIALAEDSLSLGEFEFESAFRVAVCLGLLTAWYRFLVWLLRRSCVVNFGVWLGREERLTHGLLPRAGSGH
jgi:ABC-type transport system involved in multi-copper enzyme maturation permease subunit